MSVLAVIAALAIEQWRPLGDRKLPTLALNSCSVDRDLREDAIAAGSDLETERVARRQQPVFGTGVRALLLVERLELAALRIDHARIVGDERARRVCR